MITAQQRWSRPDLDLAVEELEQALTPMELKQIGGVLGSLLTLNVAIIFT